MLNRTGAALVSLALVLVVAGVPNGNLFLSIFGLVPLMVLAVGQVMPKVAVEASIQVPDRAVRVSETVDIHVDYEVRGGRGTLMIFQPLPDEFELVEGDNIVLRRKGLARRKGRMTFAVRCRRRGRFELAPVAVELIPAMHLAGAVRVEASSGASIEFRPDLARFRRLSGGRMLAKQFMPQEDQARVGMRTSDFRDLRDYERGDAPKTINWNATARRASGQAPGQAILPLVNDYEAEGQRNVWIFLDCGPSMAVGSNVENAFEAGVQGAGSIAQFFIDRGFRVGFSLFNHPEPLHLYPDGGRRQMVRIEQALHRTETSALRGQLGQAAHRVRGFLRGGSTWVVVVTRVEAMDDADVEDLRRLRNATTARRGTTRLMVISPDPYGMVPNEDGAMEATRVVQTALDQRRMDEVRQLGIRMIHWDPGQRALHAHLMGARR